MQTRPTGPSWPIDEAWKQRVIERMDELQISRADLSRRLKVTKTAITTLFSAETKQSRLVPAIHKVLKLPLPVVSDSKLQVIDSISKNFDLLTEENKQMISELIRKLAGK
jgi:hypothetical protein